MTPTDTFAKAGYRLCRLEVLNWGTFSKKVWQIEPNGDNALLTGDIGAGKSTLVDALTTLLVRNDRITYNKAAGSDKRERNLKSYVLGAFKERNWKHRIKVKRFICVTRPQRIPSCWLISRTKIPIR
ncbi:ATP-binding protein [Spirosoma telluris]